MPLDRRVRRFLDRDGRELVGWAFTGEFTGIRQEWVAEPSRATPDVHALLHGYSLLVDRKMPRLRG